MSDVVPPVPPPRRDGDREPSPPVMTAGAPPHAGPERRRDGSDARWQGPWRRADDVHREAASVWAHKLDLLRALDGTEPPAPQRDVTDPHRHDAGAPGTAPPSARDRARPPARRGRVQGVRGVLRAVTVVADLAAGALAVGAALHVGGAPHLGALWWPIAVGGLLHLVGAGLAGAYDPRLVGDVSGGARRVVTGTAGLVACASPVALMADAGRPWRLAVVLGLPAAGAASVVVRALLGALVRWQRTRGRWTTRTVVVGLERSVAEFVRTARRQPARTVDVVGVCVLAPRGPLVEGVPVLAGPDRAGDVVLSTGADAVVLTSWSDVSAEDVRRLAWDLEGSGVRLLVAPRLAEIARPRLRWEHVGGTALVEVEPPAITGGRRVLKRAVDVVGALLALAVLWPVLLGVAVAVRATSPGPVVYRQRRVGRGGETFTMHKFRSMHVDADVRAGEVAHLNRHGAGPLFKAAHDPRVTPVGRVLRRYSLDELPQLVDVLRGHMSLVGPRPPLPHEVDEYEEDVRRRLVVTPGITGLWQVSGRSDLTWDESVRIDLNYVENWSLGLDLAIVARTVRAVVAPRGAY